MVFSCYYITDKKEKLTALVEYFKGYAPEQQIIKVNQVSNIWELVGRSNPVKLEIESINTWERNRWEIGYKFDCELDGWETT